MIASPKKAPLVEDVRFGRPYILARSPLLTFARRVVSIAVLVAIDLGGLTLGLYAALTLRSLVVDPRPILWNLIWVHESDWLPFLILMLVLVFWRDRLYGPRELREGAGRIVASVTLVAALSLAFAIGTDQHFTTFALYPIAAIFVATLISLFRWSYERLTGSLLRSLGVRRRVLLVGDDEQVAHLRATLGASRSGIDYDFVGGELPGPALQAALVHDQLDELIVADGVAEAGLLESSSRPTGGG